MTRDTRRRVYVAAAAPWESSRRDLPTRNEMRQNQRTYLSLLSLLSGLGALSMDRYGYHPRPDYMLEVDNPLPPYITAGIQEAHLVLADTSRPSTYVGEEIMAALKMGKQVMIICKSDAWPDQLQFASHPDVTRPIVPYDNLTSSLLRERLVEYLQPVIRYATQQSEESGTTASVDDD